MHRPASGAVGPHQFDGGLRAVVCKSPDQYSPRIPGIFAGNGEVFITIAHDGIQRTATKVEPGNFPRSLWR